MALPENIATALIREGLATHAGASESTFADGSKKDTDLIEIKRITVDGRTLRNVQAAVTPGSNVMTLLGLGALNRLGPFKIENGRIVFTGDQPA
jgi:predicted aspartyl protease